MGSFNVGQGGINSGPGSYGALGYTGPELAEGVTMRGGVERVILMVSSNYGTGCRRVT